MLCLRAQLVLGQEKGHFSSVGEGGEVGKGWEVEVIHAMPDSQFLDEVESKWMLKKHCALRFIITRIKHYCHCRFTCVCHSFLESRNSVF